jgi:hypothetical protein
LVLHLNYNQIAHIKPDSTYNFKVLYGTKLPVKIEWRLYKEGLFQRFNSIKQPNSPDKIQVKLPVKVGKGRLHVYVYDDAGNVMTSNKVIASGKAN